jgi:hypothetical protein
VLWGLALGLKTTAVVPALVYFGWAFGAPARRSLALKSLLVALGVFIVPLVPYLVSRREQALYALVGFESLRPIGGIVLWKLLPGSEALARQSNWLILASAALLGLWMARRRGASFLDAGGAWALVISQGVLLLLAKAIYVWYGLAASCFLYLATAREQRSTERIPQIALLATLMMWIVQSGAWVGGRIDIVVVARCAAWVVLVGAIIVLAARRLSAQRAD